MQVDWSTFKAHVDAKTLSPQITFSDANTYTLVAFDGPLTLECNLSKAKADGLVYDSADTIVFEASYLSLCNRRLSQQIDSDNALLSRVKAAPTGWTFQFRFFEFTTGLLSSLVNNDAVSGSALTDITAKFYKADNTEVVAPGTDDVDQLLITKTVIDFEAAYDFYIIGGHCKCPITPANHCRLNVVAVPDIPAAYGGTKVMVQGANFKLITGADRVDTDGRAAKLLSYSAIYHTNKLRFIIRHAAGEQNTFVVGIQHYKA